MEQNKKSAEETLKTLEDFCKQMLNEAEKKGLTRYAVAELPRMLERQLKLENFSREELYKRNPQH